MANIMLLQEAIMKEPLDFAAYSKKHFSFLIDYGFSFEYAQDEPNIVKIIGSIDFNIEFIIGLDARENVVDLYLRRKDEISQSKRFPLYQYLVEHQSYRGGFPKVCFDVSLENQIAKYALLLKDNITAILKDRYFLNS